MEKFAQMVLLADFYGPLLTDKQRKIWDLHYGQDLSLGETAEAEGISRQAVHDLIKRTEKILCEYEAKLGLVSRFLQERDKIMAVTELIKRFEAKDFRDETLWLRCLEIQAKIEDVYQRITQDAEDPSLS